MASIWGQIGLWKVISGETPPAHSWGTSGWIDRINRNPGQLTITQTGTSVFYSLTDRVEMGLRINVNTHILSRREDQLSFGQATLNSVHYSGCGPGCPLLLGSVQMPNFAIPQLRNTLNNALTGRAGYYPAFPWVNRRSQTGVGDVVLSGKVNITSENRGDNASFSVRPYISIPTHRNVTDLLNTGGQYGNVYGGIDALVSKRTWIGGLYFNAGYEYLSEVKHSGITYVGSTHALPLRVGMNTPLTRSQRLQMLVEFTAENYLNQGTPNSTFGASDPIDETLGLRWYLRPWLALNGAYRRTLNEKGGDKTGFHFALTTANLPVAPVRLPVPPVVTCSADPARAQKGTPVRLSANGSTTTGRTLTYVWSSPAGRLEGSGADARLDTTNLNPGDYTATVRVTDGADGFADCTTTVTVLAPPPPPLAPRNAPTATCSVDRASVTRGEAVNFTVNGNSRDGRTLSYAWSGAIRGTNRTQRLDTTNLNPGSYTATATVTDDRGLTAECSASTTVRAPVVQAPPATKLINSCTFPNKLKPTRVDNTCKGALDDVAQAAKDNPDATLVLSGNADPKEVKKPAKGKMAVDPGAQRAVNAKDYLVSEKGIAANRISIRSASGGPAELRNYLVPNRGTYDGPGAAVTEPKAQPRGGKKPAAMAKPAKAKAPAATTDAPAAKPDADKKAAGKKSSSKKSDKKMDDKKKDDKK